MPDFIVPDTADIPPIPPVRGVTPLREAIESLPIGGFIFIPGQEGYKGKRVSDLARSLRLRKGYTIVIRRMKYRDTPGYGVWVTGKRANAVEEPTVIPPPSMARLMGGR